MNLCGPTKQFADFCPCESGVGTAGFMHIIGGVWWLVVSWEVVILDGWPQQMEYHIICILPGSNHRALQIQNFQGSLFFSVGSSWPVI